MAESVFSTQELCDHIAHHIAVDDSPHDTLKSTALVCQALCISTQSQIFRHVILNPFHAGADSRNRDFEATVYAVRRLAGIVTTSPHLLRLIHSLNVLADAAVLRPLSGIDFPVLQKIALNFFNGQFPSAGILHFARDFIALPSICEVEIINLTMDQNQGSNVLATLFERCTRELEAITFSNVSAPSSSDNTCAPRSREQRAKIKRLQVDGSDEVEDWLISPSCPFNLTELVEVTVQQDSGNPALWQVLTSARLSITRLRIFGDIAQEIDLSKFPALTLLELPCFTSEAISGLNPDNYLETLILHLDVFAFGPQHESFTFSETDTLVANSRLPALRQVGVRISGRSTLRYDIDSVQPHFPKLAAKGLLTVIDDTYPRWLA
ncbi:hypothetical protein DFH09DRAFT_1194268 [Mycena vulgaris]|nr:hypothetical protein DFH09DRAFT_1194268 [Mycena vulgaris]